METIKKKSVLVREWIEHRGRGAVKLLCVILLCSVAQSCLTLWTVAHQAPLSMGFSKQEYWSRLPFPPPGDLPHPGIKPVSPALAGGVFIPEPPGKLHNDAHKSLCICPNPQHMKHWEWTLMGMMQSGWDSQFYCKPKTSLKNKS